MDTKLTESEREIIDIISHIHVAEELSTNVEGMEAFFSYYINKVLTPKGKLYNAELNKRKPEIMELLREQLENKYEIILEY